MMDELTHGCDSLEKIQKCLNCTQKECTNCLSYGRPRLPRARIVWSMEVQAKFIECVRQGVRNKDIAKMFGVKPSTVSTWERKLREEGAI